MLVVVTANRVDERSSCSQEKYRCMKNYWWPAAGLPSYVPKTRTPWHRVGRHGCRGAGGSAGAAGRGAKDDPPRKPCALTSTGEVQSTIYSGAIIQIFVGCSAMIKQRGFQRMRSVCDFPSSAVSTPHSQYQVTARSKIIVVWGRRVQNLSSFSNWKSFTVL